MDFQEYINMYRYKVAIKMFFYLLLIPWAMPGIKVRASDNFSNRIGETSLNNVHEGPIVLLITSLSELIVIHERQKIQ